MPRMSRQQSGLRFGFNPVVEPNVVSGEFNGHSELPRTPNTTSTEIGQARRPAPRWRSVAEEAPGPGAGLTCALCDQAITRNQIEYEVQFVHEGLSVPQIVHLHLACFAAW